MADAKISGLTDGTSLQATDEVVLARAGGNVKLTATELAASFDAAGAAAAAQAASQPLDTDLTALAGLDSSTAGAIASDGSGWIKKTYAQFKTALTLVKGDVGLGNVDNTADTAKVVASAAILTTARTIDGQSFDGSANVTVIAPGTHAATGKTTPVDADEMPLVDSAASNVLKKVTWANLKATLKTYFDTLYAIGTVTSVTSANDSIAVATTTSTPVLTVGTVDKLFTNNAPAASMALNSQKFTGSAAATAAGELTRWEQTVGAGLPWVLTGDLKNVQIFTANGTWSKPGSGTLAVVWIKGAGGGGGGGGVGASTIKGGGGGGSGGGVFFGIPLGALGSSATVTVGTGGSGGGSNANGNNGSATTQFDTVTGLCTTPASVTAGGGGAAGSAGTAGTAGTAAAPVYTGYTLSTSATNGGLGGAGAATTGGNGATGGGGAGGGLTGVPAAAAGGTGSLLNVTTTITGLGGASGGANGGISVSPMYQPSGFGQGLGGGGGGSKLGGSGNNGGIGADGYGGGGGGGGGAAVTGGSGGAGGKGGDGVVVVFVF